MSIESKMSSNHLVLCHPLLLLPAIFPSLGSFQMGQFFASGGQSIGAPASTSVLPVNIQGWFPLGLTGLISFLSKGLSRVLSSTTVQKVGSITMNKASGGDGITVELFQILKDDVMKVLHSICQKFGKLAVATGLEKVNFHPNSQKGKY